MRLRPHEIAIGMISEEFERYRDLNSCGDFDDMQGALEFLKSLTEEDFGFDCERWRNWFRSCSDEMLQLHYDEHYKKERLANLDELLIAAEERFQGYTTWRCSHCSGLCATYRKTCWVCWEPRAVE